MGQRASLSIAFLLASILPLAGCLDTHDGRPIHGPPPDLLGQHVVPTLNGPIPDHWTRIFVGPRPRPHLLGYVRSEQREGERRPIFVHWVYDVDMQLTGIMSDTGHVTRIDHQGKLTGLGQLPSDSRSSRSSTSRTPRRTPCCSCPCPS